MAAGPLIMGGASIIGSILGKNSQSKAAKEAGTITANDNAANRAFLTDIYNRNFGLINPSVQRGDVASNAIMALLGYPQASAQPPAFGSYGAPGMTPGMASAFGGMGTPYGSSNRFGFGAPDGYETMPDTWGGGGYGPTPTGAVTTTVPDARSAFDTYRGSTGYDFRFNEGTRGLQSAFSRNLDSGAASKAAIRYGQGIASDEFSRYISYLTGQSQLGLSGASALAGVGQNFAGSVVSGNQAAASAAANARLVQGNSNANFWNSLGSSFGSALGMIRGW